MAFTVTIPGRRTPYNANSFLKARNAYMSAPVGATIKNNRTGGKCRKHF